MLKSLKILYIILFILLVFITSETVVAVNITSVNITDYLNTDLSMKEIITLDIYNNTLAEFKLSLPDNAYNITVNGTIANNTISEEIACEQCLVEVEYFFPGIIIDDSENYTFYRKIDLPINITQLQYIVFLPENHTIINISDTQYTLFPIPNNMTWSSFEWSYENPEFPKEFGVRYKEKPILPILNVSLNATSTDNALVNEDMNYFVPLAFIVLILIIILIVFINKKKIK